MQYLQRPEEGIRFSRIEVADKVVRHHVGARNWKGSSGRAVSAPALASQVLILPASAQCWSSQYSVMVDGSGYKCPNTHSTILLISGHSSLSSIAPYQLCVLILRNNIQTRKNCGQMSIYLFTSNYFLKKTRSFPILNNECAFLILIIADWNECKTLLTLCLNTSWILSVVILPYGWCYFSVWIS